MLVEECPSLSIPRDSASPCFVCAPPSPQQEHTTLFLLIFLFLVFAQPAPHVYNHSSSQVTWEKICVCVHRQSLRHQQTRAGGLVCISRPVISQAFTAYELRNQLKMKPAAECVCEKNFTHGQHCVHFSFSRASVSVAQPSCFPFPPKSARRRPKPRRLYVFFTTKSWREARRGQELWLCLCGVLSGLMGNRCGKAGGWAASQSSWEKLKTIAFLETGGITVGRGVWGGVGGLRDRGRVFQADVVSDGTLCGPPD